MTGYIHNDTCDVVQNNSPLCSPASIFAFPEEMLFLFSIQRTPIPWAGEHVFSLASLICSSAIRSERLQFILGTLLFLCLLISVNPVRLVARNMRFLIYLGSWDLGVSCTQDMSCLSIKNQNSFTPGRTGLTEIKRHNTPTGIFLEKCRVTFHLWEGPFDSWNQTLGNSKTCIF